MNEQYEPYWHGRDEEYDDHDDFEEAFEEREEMRRDYRADMDAFDKAMEDYNNCEHI